MGVIVLAVPEVQIPVVIQEAAKIWFGLRVEWIGWDGSVWNLTDPGRGVFLTPGGVEGFGAPEYTEWVQESPAVPGQIFRGLNAKPRKMFFPLAIYSDAGSQAWFELQTSFLRTVRAGKYGTVRVTTPGGQVRTISARPNGAPTSLSLDPFKTGYQGYPLAMVADQPYWAGEPVEGRFDSGSQSDFFGGTGGPPFTISTGSSFASAKITNSGDEDAWPVWTVVGGDTTTVEVGINGSMVEIPFAVESGKALQINTDPRVQTAVYGDWDDAKEAVTNTTDRTGDLGAVEFAPVPPGEQVPLTVTFSGTGSVRVSITPLYERAW